MAVAGSQVGEVVAAGGAFMAAIMQQALLHCYQTPHWIGYIAGTHAHTRAPDPNPALDPTPARPHARPHAHTRRAYPSCPLLTIKPQTRTPPNYKPLKCTLSAAKNSSLSSFWLYPHCSARLWSSWCGVAWGGERQGRGQGLRGGRA